MKRTLVWGIVICVCLFTIVAAISPADDEEESAQKNSSYSESVTDDESDVELFPEEVEPVTTKPKVQKNQSTASPSTKPSTTKPTTAIPTTTAPKISREYSNALREAEDYLNSQAFSKQGLYDQLTSKYGGQYPKAAAQYAVDNVDTDWKENALKSAESYLESQAFSKQGLYEQLCSNHGEQYTKKGGRVCSKQCQN